MRVKEESEKAGLKLNIQKSKTMTSSPITSRERERENTPAVLGGIMMMLFGTIASVGVQSMTRHIVNFAATRNTVIIALMLSIGVGGAVFTVGSFSLSSIGLAAIVGIILNLILPGRHGK